MAVRKLETLTTVDTSDLKISQVLPRFLELRSAYDPLIGVELDDSQQFYRARLAELNVYACGYTREQLIGHLIERVDVCWDEFVREDSSDLSRNAKILRENLLNTFKEVEN